MANNECKHYGELMKTETPDLTEELDCSEYFSGEKNNSPANRKAAELDFVKNHMHDWAEAERYAYCFFICSEKDCMSRDKYLNDLRGVIEDYRLKLEKKFGEEVTFETASRKYLSFRGPSFWKGLAGVVFPLILSKNNNE